MKVRLYLLPLALSSVGMVAQVSSENETLVQTAEIDKASSQRDILKKYLVGILFRSVVMVL